MAELFRYIQQAFAVPDSTGSIDTHSNSDFQLSLRHAVAGHESPVNTRAIAAKFLDQNFPQGGDNPLQLSDQMLSIRQAAPTLGLTL